MFGKGIGMKKFRKGDIVAKMELDTNGCVHVRVTAASKLGKREKLDRDEIYRWGFGPGSEELADRLIRCINDSKVFLCYDVLEDVDSNLYLDVDMTDESPSGELVTFLGRYMNADLVRMGY